MIDEECGVLLVSRTDETAARAAAALQSAGCAVRTVCGSGGEALRAAQNRNPDILVIAGSLPDTTGPALIADMLRQADCGVILVTTATEKAYVERSISRRGIVCLVAPAGYNELLEALETLRRERQTIVESELTHNRLEETARRNGIVAKAKETLMKTREMSEPLALRTIQKASMDSGVPMPEIARIILESGGRYIYPPKI